MAERIQTFREFWPFYVGEHSKPLTRTLHFCGTTLFLALVGATLATQKWWMVILWPIGGYGFAWVGHFFVEKNRPATFTYPLWSFAADFVMYYKMWSGTMTSEVERTAQARTR
jgi:hypothetical protein